MIALHKFIFLQIFSVQNDMKMLSKIIGKGLSQLIEKKRVCLLMINSALFITEESKIIEDRLTQFIKKMIDYYSLFIA